MSLPSTSPVALLNDALASFTQAAHALVVAEDHARGELAHAVAEERKAQRQASEMKLEVERWKAATEKAEVTIKHQTETIAQTRREAQQWKDQFMKVEEERCILSKRVDALVAEQLTLNRRSTYHNEPLTPRSQYTHADEPSTSSAASRREMSSNPSHVNTEKSDMSASPLKLVSRSQPAVSSAYVDIPSMSNSRAHTTENAPPRASPRAPSHDSSLPRQRVIRRVHAIVEIPVKDEEEDHVLQSISQASPASNMSDYSENGLSRPKSKTANTTAKRKNVRQRKGRADGYVNGDQNDGSERKKGPVDEYIDDGSDQDDRSDGDEFGVRSYGEEDEDELMLGTEDNQDELYGSEHVVNPHKKTPPLRPSYRESPSKSSSLSAKKRKVDNIKPAGTGTGRKVRRQ